MPNYKITLEYEGSDFVGWQQQENGVSIQGEIQYALFKLTGNKIIVFGAGRTDAGVHAYAQVASFNLKGLPGNCLYLGGIGWNSLEFDVFLLNSM